MLLICATECSGNCIQLLLYLFFGSPELGVRVWNAIWNVAHFLSLKLKSDFPPGSFSQAACHCPHRQRNSGRHGGLTHASKPCSRQVGAEASLRTQQAILLLLFSGKDGLLRGQPLLNSDSFDDSCNLLKAHRLGHGERRRTRLVQNVNAASKFYETTSGVVLVSSGTAVQRRSALLVLRIDVSTACNEILDQVNVTGLARTMQGCLKPSILRCKQSTRLNEKFGQLDAFRQVQRRVHVGKRHGVHVGAIQNQQLCNIDSVVLDGDMKGSLAAFWRRSISLHK